MARLKRVRSKHGWKKEDAWNTGRGIGGCGEGIAGAFAGMGYANRGMMAGIVGEKERPV